VDETEVKVDRENNRLIFEGAKTKISDDDKNGVEEAVRLKEKAGGSVTVVCQAGSDAKKSLKEALAMGCDRARLLSDKSFIDSDAIKTAQILAAAIRKLESYDIIICATATTDVYSGVVGPALAETLGIPCVAFASKISLDGTKVRAERNLEDGIEVVESNFPVLITVLREINTPRFPTLLQIMGAGKKELIEWSSKDLALEPHNTGKDGSALRVAALNVPKSARKKQMIDGNPSESAQRLAEILLREGLVK
jgi:electron transfer flavoprotein beta subunit